MSSYWGVAFFLPELVRKRQTSVIAATNPGIIGAVGYDALRIEVFSFVLRFSMTDFDLIFAHSLDSDFPLNRPVSVC